MEEKQEEQIIDATGRFPIPPIPNPVEPLLPRFTWPWKRRKQGAVPAQIVDSEPPIEPVEDSDDFRRQRRLIESFSEDYLSWPDRIKIILVQVVAFALPVLAVLAVGYDVGRFFAPALGDFSSYLLSFGIESGIAACTIQLGRVLQKGEEGAGHWIKAAILGAVWLVATAASGGVMYLISLSALPAGAHLSGLSGAVIALRVVAVGLLDVMSVTILFFRGRSLQRHLADMGRKSHAIAEVNEAELDIQRAQETAARRREEDQAYMESKKQREAVVTELESMMSEALLSHARQNLLKGPEEGTNRRVGRY